MISLTFEIQFWASGFSGRIDQRAKIQIQRCMFDAQRHGVVNDLHLQPAPEKALPRFPIPTVGGLISDDAGRVLLMRTNKWSNLWGIPGGKIEWGETSLDALRREVMEETGLSIADIEFVCVQDAVHPPEFYKDAHFLLLNYTCRAPGIQTVRLNSEAQEFRWLTLEEAFQLPLNTPTRILLEQVR